MVFLPDGDPRWLLLSHKEGTLFLTSHLLFAFLQLGHAQLWIPPFGHMLLLLLAPNAEVDREPGAEKAKTQDQKPQGQAGISAGPELTQSCSL